MSSSETPVKKSPRLKKPSVPCSHENGHNCGQDREEQFMKFLIGLQLLGDEKQKRFLRVMASTLSQKPQNEGA